MKRKILSKLPACVVMMLTASSSFAQSTSECPLLIASGSWSLAHDVQIYSTGGMWFGGRNGSLVRVENQECGKKLSIDGNGKTVIFNHVTGNRYQTEPEKHYQDGMELTIVYDMDVVDRISFDVMLRITARGMQIPGAGMRRIRFNYNEGIPVKRPECYCDKLDDYLAERIEEAEYFIDLYGNPQYWERPADLPSDVNWDAYMYEVVLNGIVEGQSPQQAASDASDFSQSDDYGTGDDAAALSDDAPPGATTNTITCQIEIGSADPSACFPQLWIEEAAYHESLHADRCNDMRDAHRAWDILSGGEPPERYHILVNQPKEAGLEEVRAYEATRNWLRTWKQRNCSE